MRQADRRMGRHSISINGRKQDKGRREYVSDEDLILSKGKGRRSVGHP